MKNKVTKLIQDLKQSLLPVCQTPHEAEQQAWWLLEELTKKNESALLTEDYFSLSEEQEKTLNQWIEQRTTNNKPIQYILGHVPFCDIDILVKPPILIPRPETEELTCWLIKKLEKLKDKKLNILDLCTGSGCIALALAKAFPNSNITGIDINPKAIELAQKNMVHNNIKNAVFLLSDFYSALDTKFDLIISNPPYIAQNEWDTLNPTITEWEDSKALITDNNGLFAFEEIIKNARDYLKENKDLKEQNIPQVTLEIGKGQESSVKALLSEENFENINIFRDLSGINRWIAASPF